MPLCLCVYLVQLVLSLAAVERAPRSPAWALLRGEEQAAITAARDRLAQVRLRRERGRDPRGDAGTR